MEANNAPQMVNVPMAGLMSKIHCREDCINASRELGKIKYI